MNDCAECRRPLPDHSDSCPACGATSSLSNNAVAKTASPAEANSAYVAIARFGNIAEAGYFHTELEGHLECELRLTTHNDFDAATHTCGSQFVLSAPSAVAEQATRLLKELLLESSSSEPEIPERESPLRPAFEQPRWAESETRIHWTPIILTLTAGTFIVWAAKQVQRHGQEPVRGGARQVDLWEHVSNSSEPWIQQLGEGRGRRELEIDRVRRVATLREDRDGDGIFEKTEHVKLGAANH